MAATAAQPPTQPLRDPDAMDVDSEGPTGSQQSVGGSTPTSESVTTPTTPTPEAVTANQSPVSGTPLPDQPIPDGAKAPQWKTDNGPSTDKPPAAAESINIPKPTDAPKAAKDTPKEAPKKTEAPKPTPQPEAPKVDKGPVPELKDLLNSEKSIGSGLDCMSMSVSELQDLLDQATALKGEGNKAFVIRPHTAATLKTAEEDYKRALGKLPNVPKHLPMPTLQDLAEKERIVEINDEEAEQIEKDQQAGPVRCNVDNEIRDAKKVLWANLGAVYVAQGRDREAVDACTRALHYDPTYQKALLRRASASEKLGTWAALTNAQRDYIALMGMLPASPMPGSADAQNLKQVEQGLKTLPAKIRAAKDKETNEATDKIGQSKISS